MFRVTIFKNKFDKSVKNASDISWEHFVAKLNKHEVRAQKDGPLFSPVGYVDSLDEYILDGDIVKEKQVIGKKWRSTKTSQHAVTTVKNEIIRNNQNVRNIYMAVVDYDSGAVDPGILAEKLVSYNYIIYSTFSNSAEKKKFRLVLPFKNPLTPEEFKASWPWGLEGIDESCKDLSRMFYLPSCALDGKNIAFVMSNINGRFYSPVINMGDLKKIPQAEEKKKKKPRGDYTTLDAVTWFTIHGAYISQAPAPDKHFVRCPWGHLHTDGVQGETDTVLWTEKDKWPTFNCSHSHCTKRSIKDVLEIWDDADSYCSKTLKKESVKTDILIRALGHDEAGRYYYQCNQTSHIVALRASEHKELFFYSICADREYWFSRFGDNDSGQIQWKIAAQSMMAQCHAIGYFQSQRVRGGGVWIDDERVVAHLGSTLLVDGLVEKLTTLKSKFVYEAMVHEVELSRDLPTLNAEERRALYDTAKRFPLEKTTDAVYLAGMAVAGLISGVLDWRPHIWVCGDQASGKSSLLTYYLNPLWAPAGGLMSEGKTSEAGIRQKLRRNAYPVIIDESESDSINDIERVAGLVSLARSSSSATDGRVLKGTQGGSGQEFNVRSCFAFCSISHGLSKAQDRQRFTLINAKMSPHHVESWPQFKAHLKQNITEETGLRLYKTVIFGIDHILENIKAMTEVLIARKCDSRFAEQAGTLIGCAGFLLLQEPITHETGGQIVDQLSIKNEIPSEESSVPRRILQLLLSLILDQKSGFSVAELLERGYGTRHYDQEAVALLMRYGIRKTKGGDLVVANAHHQLSALLARFGVSNYCGMLALLEGASMTTYRFGVAGNSRAAVIPKKTIENGYAISDEDTEGGFF